MAGKSQKQLAERYDGRVENDDIVNEQQWRAIQRFGGGKVAAEKARKIAMERLKKITGKDVAFEYMFSNTDDVPLPPPPPVDPLFAAEVGAPRVSTKTHHTRAPSSTNVRSRSASPLSRSASTAGGRSLSTSPDRTPRSCSNSFFGNDSPAMSARHREPTSTVASTPPHGKHLRPAEFRKGKLPDYGSPPSSSPRHSPGRPQDATPRDASPLGSPRGQARRKPGIADRISPQPVRSSHDPSAPMATLSPSRPRPASASPSRPRHGSAWKPGGTTDTLRKSGSTQKRADKGPVQESASRSVSPGKGFTGHSLRRSRIRSANQARKSAREEEFFDRWKKGMADPHGQPWRHSQPQSRGAMVPVEVVTFNFDEAHPAVAEEHFKRSQEQNKLLEAERKAQEAKEHKMEMKIERDTALQTISCTGSRAPSLAGSRAPSVTGRRHSRSVSGIGAYTSGRMASGTGGYGRSPLETEMHHVRALERETEELKQRSRDAQARAHSAIASSEQQSARGRRRQTPSASRVQSEAGGAGPYYSGEPASGQAQAMLDVDALAEKVEALANGISSQAQGGSSSVPSSATTPRQPHAQAARSSLSSSSQPTPRRGGKTVSFNGFDLEPPPQYCSAPASLADHAAEAQNQQRRHLGAPSGAAWSSAENVDDSQARSQAETEPVPAWVPQRISRDGEEEEHEYPEEDVVEAPGGGLYPSDMEVMVAAGKFDPMRYDDYLHAIDEEMDERAQKGMAMGRIEDGYNSDLEREDEEAEAEEEAEAAAREAELQQFPERRLQQTEEQVEILREEWMQQDDWMDHYRQAPEYYDEPQAEYFEDGAGDFGQHHPRQPADDERRHTDRTRPPMQGHDAATERRYSDPYDNDGGEAQHGYHAARDSAAHHPQQEPDNASPGRAVPAHYDYRNADATLRHGFSADDLELLNSEYIPFIQAEFPVYAIAEDNRKQEHQKGRLSAVYTPDYPNYHSEGEDHRGGTVYWPLTKSAKKKMHKSQHRTLRCTIPQPFKFEHRESLSQRKPIMAAKLEAELALKRQEEQAAVSRSFRANPFPKSTMEPRYSMLMDEWETMRASNREATRQWYKAIEAPFSFYYTDKLRTEAKKEVVKKLTNPDRFQQNFHAKPPPEHVFEDRFKEMSQAEEDKKRERRARAEEKLQEVSMPRGMEERMATSQRRAEERRRQRRGVDPEWQTKHPKNPLGYMPNFDELHQEMAFELAKQRARVRRGVTVPEEFKLGGRTREEAATRHLRALERKKAIELDMLKDQDELPETRWPYTTPRGKVPPAAVPATRSPAKDFIKPTRASLLRTSAVTEAKKAGRFDERGNREARQLQEAQKHKERAKALVKKRMQERAADRAAAAAEEAVSQYAADGGSTSAAAAGGVAYEQPMQYVEARHHQAAEVGREKYEDSLLRHGGIDTYRYVEGTGN